MKCLIGLESIEGLEASVSMLTRLAPSGLETEILYVIDCAKAYPGYGIFPAAEIAATLVSDLERDSKRLIGQAERIIKKAGLRFKAKVKWGAVGQHLLDEAQAYQADVVAVHRKDVSSVERVFLGSTSRSVLLGAEQSVLVTKGGSPERGAITAVLGVDHSQYCQKCVEVLLGLNLKGIAKLVLVTAIDQAGASGSRINIDKLRDHLAATNEQLCARFASAGIESTYEIAVGHPNVVLSKAMSSAKADLMIVGAQGHGFIERLLIGSTSLHQVAVESYPVLVLRV